MPSITHDNAKRTLRSKMGMQRVTLCVELAADGWLEECRLNVRGQS